MRSKHDPIDDAVQAICPDSVLEERHKHMCETIEGAIKDGHTDIPATVRVYTALSSKPKELQCVDVVLPHISDNKHQEYMMAGYLSGYQLQNTDRTINMEPIAITCVNECWSVVVPGAEELMSKGESPDPKIIKKLLSEKPSNHPDRIETIVVMTKRFDNACHFSMARITGRNKVGDTENAITIEAFKHFKGGGGICGGGDAKLADMFATGMLKGIEDSRTGQPNVLEKAAICHEINREDPEKGLKALAESLKKQGERPHGKHTS